MRAPELLEIGQPDLDERPHGVLEPRLARDRERLFVALARLGGVDTLLEAVVARDEQPLDLRARIGSVIVLGAHGPKGYRWYHPRAVIPVFAVIQVLVSAALITLVLMHSGRESGFGGMGFTPQSQGGTHIVEKNLTRLTTVVAVLFFLNTVVLYRLLA